MPNVEAFIVQIAPGKFTTGIYMMIPNSCSIFYPEKVTQPERAGEWKHLNSAGKFRTCATELLSPDILRRNRYTQVSAIDCSRMDTIPQNPHGTTMPAVCKMNKGLQEARKAKSK